MRDKVKRFLSILMTALMLVNLLPVGALAEGVKISNSVQNRWPWEPKPTPKPAANVYVYVKVTGDKAGLTINQSGWYTIGKSENVPGMGTPYWSMHGSHSFSDVGVSYKTVLKTNFTRWTDNQKIDLDQITWTEFYVDNGADDYVKAGTYTWHMNGTIDIKQLPSVYTIKYVDYDTKKLIHSYEKTGLMGQTPEKITAPDSLQENLYSFYFVNGHPKEQTVDFKKDKGELTFYYKKNTAKLTINYVYKDGSKAAESHEAELPYQSDYSVTSPDITGYTADNPVVSGTMPAGNVEVTVTYTKNSYNLKINYEYEDGSKAAESHEDTLSYQSDYSVTSPDITGYTADNLVVSGTMPANDVEVTVTYTKNSYKLKINYVYEDGSKAAESHEAELPYQSDYSVESPVIEGYTANNLVVSGTMPAGNVEVTVTYTKNSYSYTVEHYWIGDKDKLDAQPFHTDADENQTALFDSAVAYQENGASWVIRTNPVYTFAKADPEKITITSDPSKNVLKLYYYKNVKLTANSDTLPYNGKEQHVFGYTCAVAEMKDGRVEYVPWTGEKPLTFEGVSASGLGKDVNKDGYRVEFNETPIGETDGLYYVNESQTGTLTITPAPVTLQAPIASKTYDGEPLKAEDYVHSYVEGVNFADDFAAVILTGSQTLVGSSSSLITEVIPKEGKKLKNYKFTFLPGTLTVTDGTGDDPVKPENVVTKTHIPKDMGYNLGDEVTFTISVKNIYNTPKTITLTEKENVKFSNGENAIEFKDVPAGETVTAEATYTITSEDILEGVFHNTVTADFTGGGSWTAEDTVITAELDTTLNVTKTSDVPDGQKAALGQTITYTIKVQNAGNVPYTNVKVEDPMTGLTETIETLAVGETKTFTTEYVVTEADVLKGSVLNTATATGDKIKDPKSDEPKEPNGGDEVEIPTFAPITLKPKDVTATYNGAAITGKDVEITSGKLLEGHKLSAAVIGSGVNAGSYELTLDPEKIKIVDANNKDVSEMYARTILPGKLIINKRSVLITSQSATKTYDGSALTRPAVTITGDGFVPGELAKAEATGSITKVGSTPNTIRYTTTGAFNAANYSIVLSVGTLTVTEKPKPEPRRTFNLTINYVYQNGKRAAASYNRGGLKNGETFDITSPVIAGYTASETVVSGTIYNRDIKVTVIYTADGVNLDDYGVPLGLGNITMNVGDCFE